jgi:gamma-glutamylputrescine oxidase
MNRVTSASISIERVIAPRRPAVYTPSMLSSASGTYYDSAVVARPQRPKLAADLDCEVVVVGGGLAGLWTALELARRGREVAVVEAGRIGEGASGSHAGLVSPGYAEDSAVIAGRVGERHARALWQLSVEGVQAVRDVVAETGMPGVDPVPGRLIAFRTAGEDAAGRLAERLVRWGSDAEVWPREQVRAALDTPRYRAAVSLPEGFHLHPLNFLLGLARAVEAAGGRIFEHSPAVRVDLDGVRKLIETPSGRLRTAEVVVCGSAGVGRVFPQLAHAILPMTAHVGVTAPLGERLAAAIRYAGAVSDNRRGGDRFRLIGDRLLWSCGLTTRTRPPAHLARRIAADIAAVFPQLAGVDIDHAWSGTMGSAVHRMPQLGRLAPGLWIASAFGGQGMAPAAIAGQLIASAILDGDDRWRLFIPFGLAPAGWVGRLAMQAGLWSAGRRERRAEAALVRAERQEKPAAKPEAPPAAPGDAQADAAASVSSTSPSA